MNVHATPLTDAHLPDEIAGRAAALLLFLLHGPATVAGGTGIATATTTLAPESLASAPDQPQRLGARRRPVRRRLRRSDRGTGGKIRKR